MSPLFEWLSEHLTCECGPLRKLRTRHLSHVVDLSSLPKLLRFDETADVIIEFTDHCRKNKIGFGWWIAPSALGTAFYT